MKPVYMTNTAWAQIQCCGAWLQIGGTIVGVFPKWWFNPGDRRHSPQARHPFRLGVKIWAADHYGGVHTVFSIETPNRRFTYSRAFAETSEGCAAGWSTWRRQS